MRDTPMKRCTGGEQCVHPDGCWQPATPEYFHRTKRTADGLTQRCRACRNAATRRWNTENRDKVRETKRRYYAETPDKVREAQRRWQAANPEKVKEIQRRHQAKPETKEYQRRWHQENGHTPERKARDAENARKYRAARKDDPEFQEHRREWSRAYYRDVLSRNPNRKEQQRESRQRPENKRRDAEYQREYRRGEKYRVYITEYEQRPNVRRRRHAQWIKRETLVRSLPYDFTPDMWQRALDYFNGVCPACGRQFVDLFDERTAHADHWIPLSSPDCPGTVPTNIIPLCGGIDGCNQSKGYKDPIEWLTWKFGKRRAREILKRIEAYFEWVKAQGGT